MGVINGNFYDSEGNLVNIADLLMGTSNVSPENKDHMSPISGWFYDGEGNRVNIVDIIRQADGTDVKGISVNSSSPMSPNKDGIVELTISGVGEVVGLSTEEKNTLIGLLT